MNPGFDGKTCRTARVSHSAPCSYSWHNCWSGPHGPCLVDDWDPDALRPTHNLDANFGDCLCLKVRHKASCLSSSYSVQGPDVVTTQDTLFQHALPKPTGKKKFALGAKKIQFPWRKSVSVDFTPPSRIGTKDTKDGPHQSHQTASVLEVYGRQYFSRRLQESPLSLNRLRRLGGGAPSVDSSMMFVQFFFRALQMPPEIARHIPKASPCMSFGLGHPDKTHRTELVITEEAAPWSTGFPRGCHRRKSSARPRHVVVNLHILTQVMVDLTAWVWIDSVTQCLSSDKPQGGGSWFARSEVVILVTLRKWICRQVRHTSAACP